MYASLPQNWTSGNGYLIKRNSYIRKMLMFVESGTFCKKKETSLFKINKVLNFSSIASPCVLYSAAYYVCSGTAVIERKQIK